MKGKENQRIELTKILLKNSLIELMNTKPINKITIKELCENAGINRSTFYLYYTDQLALLTEIENELLLNMMEHLKNINSNIDSQHYLKELLHYMKDNSGIFQPLLCQHENLTFQKTFIQTALMNLKTNLKLQCEDKECDYMYYYLIMGCLGLIKKWFESNFDITYDKLANMIFSLSDNAVSTYINGTVTSDVK